MLRYAWYQTGRLAAGSLARQAVPVYQQSCITFEDLWTTSYSTSGKSEPSSSQPDGSFFFMKDVTLQQLAEVHPELEQFVAKSHRENLAQRVQQILDDQALSGQGERLDARKISSLTSLPAHEVDKIIHDCQLGTFSNTDDALKKIHELVLRSSRTLERAVPDDVEGARGSPSSTSSTSAALDAVFQTELRLRLERERARARPKAAAPLQSRPLPGMGPSTAQDPWAPLPGVKEARASVKTQVGRMLHKMGYINKDPSLLSSVRILKLEYLAEILEECGLPAFGKRDDLAERVFALMQDPSAIPDPSVAYAIPPGLQQAAKAISSPSTATSSVEAHDNATFSDLSTASTDTSTPAFDSSYCAKFGPSSHKANISQAGVIDSHIHQSDQDAAGVQLGGSSSEQHIANVAGAEKSVSEAAVTHSYADSSAVEQSPAESAYVTGMSAASSSVSSSHLPDQRPATVDQDTAAAASSSSVTQHATSSVHSLISQQQVDPSASHLLKESTGNHARDATQSTVKSKELDDSMASSNPEALRSPKAASHPEAEPPLKAASQQHLKELSSGTGSSGPVGEGLREIVLWRQQQRQSIRSMVEDPDLISHWLVKAKAQDVCCIDLRRKAGYAEWMIIGTGLSQQHVAACVHAVRYQIGEKLKSLGEETVTELGLHAPDVVGPPVSDWVALHVGSCVVHMFTHRARRFYDLEALWGTERTIRWLGSEEGLMTLDTITTDGGFEKKAEERGVWSEERVGVRDGVGSDSEGVVVEGASVGRGQRPSGRRRVPPLPRSQ